MSTQTAKDNYEEPKNPNIENNPVMLRVEMIPNKAQGGQQELKYLSRDSVYL